MIRRKLTTRTSKRAILSVAAAVGAVGLGVATVPVVVVTPFIGGLHLVGFGPGGIFKDSRAATAQAGVGNVVAPGLFATFTSAAMGGYGVATITGVVQGVGLGVAGVGAVLGAVASFL